MMKAVNMSQSSMNCTQALQKTKKSPGGIASTTNHSRATLKCTLRHLPSKGAVELASMAVKTVLKQCKPHLSTPYVHLVHQ